MGCVLSKQSAFDGSVLVEMLCDGMGVYSTHSGNVCCLQPLPQGTKRRVVVRLRRDMRDDDPLHLDPGALKRPSRHTIIPLQGIGQHENLPTIGGICQGFHIASHSRVEDHFAAHVSSSPKGITVESSAVC